MNTLSAIPDVGAGNAQTASESRPAVGLKWAFIIGALALVLVMPGAGFARDLILVADPVLRTADPATPAPEALKPDLTREVRERRSYVIPALEVAGFLFLLNQYDRHFIDEGIYGTNARTTWKNLNHPHVIDTDPFRINQFLHPYQGSLYFGFARSAGLNYWESFAYTAAGSFTWENAGETGRASINDEVASGIGGTFFGEPLFRMANLVLESGGGKPGFWQELGAAVISPPTGFNRLVFGNRFDPVFPSHNPATFLRLRLGESLTSQVTDQGISDTVHRRERVMDVSLAYGLPGKPDYSYSRPFDYFHFEFSAISNPDNSFDNVMTRGLLLGKKYELGESYRGVWGLYGSYDYISPQIFRISSTAASLGTTAQWWLSHAVALQGTGLAGVGYGAAGTIASKGDRDYHYGVVPQGLLALRLIFADLAMLDMTGREYYVSGVGSDNSGGREYIARGNVSLTMRVRGRHAVGLQYVVSHRNAYYTGLDDRHQTVGTVSLAYNFLGDTRFGAVEWRTFDGETR